MKMANSSIEQVKKYGCALLSFIEGVKKLTEVNKSVDDIYRNLVDLDIISSDCYINSYDKLSQYFGLDLECTKTTYEELDLSLLNENSFALAFTTGHVELITGIGEDNLLQLFDPGYWSDTYIDSNGCFRNEKGFSSYKGNYRKCNSVRIFHG